MVRPSSVRNRNADRARVSATATANATSRFTSTNTGPSQSVAVASDDVTRVGSGPNTISATFSSTSATPSIRRICISWGASTIRSTSPRWIRRPSTNSAAAQRANPAYGSTPACVASRYARYMPQTIMSPWAKFTTRITPKISVSPTAIRLYTPPNSTPLINPCPTSVRSTLHQVEEKHGRSALALDCSTPIPPRQRAWANDEQVGLAQTEIDGEMGCRMGEDDDGPTPSAAPAAYDLGRGKTNFCTAASRGQTATGFCERIWII